MQMGQYYGGVEVRREDKFVWDILPKGCLPEVMSGYAAQVAAAVSGKYERLAAYRDALAETLPVTRQALPSNPEFLHLVYRAFALGFADKWE